MTVNSITLNSIFCRVQTSAACNVETRLWTTLRELRVMLVVAFLLIHWLSVLLDITKEFRVPSTIREHYIACRSSLYPELEYITLFEKMTRNNCGCAYIKYSRICEQLINYL